MNGESRPKAAPGNAVAASSESLPAATVVEVGRNDAAAWILAVECPHCGRRHRHGYVPGDHELGGLVREAGCRRGSYELALPSGVAE